MLFRQYLGLLGVGPLFFGAGGDAGAAGGDTGDQGGGSGGATGGQTTTTQTTQRTEPMIPKSRLDEVLSELRTLKAAEEERERKSLESKGEHEKIAAREKERADRAIAQLKETRLQAAFVMAATGKVNDVEAAWRLADLEGVSVSDDGKVSGDIEKVVTKTVERYPLLKGQTTLRTDDSASGAGGNPPDVSKLTTEQKIERGLEQAIAQLPPQKQGLFRQGA